MSDKENVSVYLWELLAVALVRTKDRVIVPMQASLVLQVVVTLLSAPLAMFISLLDWGRSHVIL